MDEKRYATPAEDMEEIHLGDKRLNARLVDSIRERMQCQTQSRASAKAFYRLLGNTKFNAEKLAEQAQKKTMQRVSDYESVLLVQDTVDVELNGHKKTEGLGYCSEHLKGIKTHTCLAVSEDGLPLGIVKQSYITRQQAKSTLTEAQKRAREIQDKESFRWIETAREAIAALPPNTRGITVCDRECDIYEFFEEVQTLESDFVVRVAQDRKTETSEKLFDRMDNAPVKGKCVVDVPRDTRKNRAARQAKMEVCAQPIRISKKENSLPLNIVRIHEVSQAPTAEDKIEWVLATSLPIESESEVMKVVDNYIQRWKIERFHYVLKGGCKVEQIQQRSVERIMPVILICSMIASFILAMTYLGRVMPDVPCDVLFSEGEWKLLYRFAKRTKKAPDTPYPLGEAIRMLGELGTGKRAPSDGDFGVKSLWLGLRNFFLAANILVGQV